MTQIAKISANQKRIDCENLRNLRHSRSYQTRFLNLIQNSVPTFISELFTKILP